MSLFKLDPNSIKATRSSEFDEQIEKLFEEYDKDGTNVHAFKQEEEGRVSGFANRLRTDYQGLLDERNLSFRTLTVSLKQKQLKDAGYTKMICLVPKQEESDGSESSSQV